MIREFLRVLFSGPFRGLLAKRQLCPFGCGYGSFTPELLDQHVTVDHAGDDIWWT